MWVAYSLSAVVSAISLVARGYITIDQLRKRRRDLLEVDAPRPYLHRLKAKIKDGERALNMVAPPPSLFWYMHTRPPRTLSPNGGAALRAPTRKPALAMRACTIPPH